MCVHTLANVPKADIDKTTWDAQRMGYICGSAPTFAYFKGLIEKECSIANNCDYDTTAQIKAHIKALNILLDHVGYKDE